MVGWLNRADALAQRAGRTPLAHSPPSCALAPSWRRCVLHKTSDEPVMREGTQRKLFVDADVVI